MGLLINKKDDTEKKMKRRNIKKRRRAFIEEEEEEEEGVYSFIRGKTNSLSRSADAGQPSGLEETPAPRELHTRVCNTAPYSELEV